MRKTTVLDFGARDQRSGFHTGVSLHAHTHYSREVLADLPAYILRVPIVAILYQRQLQAYLAREGHDLDFSKGWWHPPVAPRAVFESEVRQIEERLELWPLVSITDHDDLSAGFDLQRLYAQPRAPLSFEWTVPYARGFFHLGVHNLPAASAEEWFWRLSAFTAETSEETLEDLLAGLNRQPEILIVFNHPCWDLAGVGNDEHEKQMRRFLAAYGTQLHALELNGYRPHKENAVVHDLAAATGHPLISGGDRHGCAPNALLNLTNARSFAEFTAEIRDGVSHVLVMPEYRQHLATRIISSAADVMRWYRLYPAGRQHWTDRVTWDMGGSVRPLSAHWRNGGPLWVRGSVKVFQVISSPVALRCLRAALETADGLLAARQRGPVQPRVVRGLTMRVAFFTDSYYEANGVARTTAALESCARRRDVPMLLVHAGSRTRVIAHGSVTRVELKRWRSTSFGLEHDMRFDLAMWRHLPKVRAAVRKFAPDVLHFTGPSDIGLLGAYLGRRSGIPMLGSWHTNLHEYAARRLRLEWASDAMRSSARRAAECQSLRALMLFYTLPRVILAPNDELSALLVRETGKPTFLMSRGVDTALFTPEKRTRVDRRTVNIGYVGRLSPEKSVRQLQAIQTALAADGLTNVRFTVVGDGRERPWLREHLRRAELTGVLRGEALATAYANMDLFVFPSETETVGNVVLEAMASGVPVVAMAHGGPKFVADPGRSAVLAADHRALIDAVRALVPDAARRDEMRRAARARALELSWDRIFDEVCRGYATAISLAQGTGGAQRVAPPAVSERALVAGSVSGARLPTGR